MATYVIGDIQGCFASLQLLLQRIGFDPNQDRIWLVGDLVNRGPGSLNVLRWARELGERAVVVLGNHELHLLALAAGAAEKKKRSTLKKVLNAYDREELIDWLRRLPLIHVEGDFVMVHAGLHPSWSIAEATSLAQEVSAVLCADDWHRRITDIARSAPPPWSADLPAGERVAATAGVLTKGRLFTGKGRPRYDFAGSLDEVPPDCTPWFAIPHARWHGHQVLFGHWAALGLYMDENCIGLDSGCVWGRELTAVRLEDRQIFQVASVEG
jgi:bis(5'-nucleosyl)-tetraphosphatase (symmetrical)